MSSAIFLISVILLCSPAPQSPPAETPTPAELRAGGEAARLAPLVRRWLDDYPASAEGWSDQDLGMVLAQVVDLGEAHHPAAAIFAERLARKRRTGRSAKTVAAVVEAHGLASRVRLARGENAEALDLLRYGLERCGQPNLSSAASSCAFLLRDRALIRLRLGRDGGAEQDLALAISWLEPFPSSEAWVPVLNSTADLACWRGEAERCLELYRRATEVAEALHGADGEVAAYGYLGIGWAAALGARWGEARAAFERAERVWTERLGAGHARLADALVEYGDLLRRAGDADEARRVLRRAVHLRQVRMGEDAFDLPRALDALSLAAIELGDRGFDRGAFYEAAAAVERSAAIRRRTRPPEHVEHGRTLVVRSRLEAARGEIGTARRLLEEALEVQRREWGAGHPETAETLLLLAELELARNPGQAIRLAERARNVLALAYGERHPALARAWWLDARGRLAAGQDAITPALRAEAIVRQHRRLAAPGLAERDLLAAGETYPPALDLALAVLLAESTPSRAPSRARILAVWQAVARSRSPVLEIDRTRASETAGAAPERAAGSLATDPGKGAVADRYADPRMQLIAARRALGHLQVLAAGDDVDAHRRRLAAARQRVDEAERAASRGLPATSSPRLELGHVLDGLEEEQALIAFRLFKDEDSVRLAAFVAAGGQLAVRDLGTWRPLERAIQRLRDELADGSESRFRDVSSRLRRRLIEPLAAALGGADRLFLVPDGPLFLLPFGTLAKDGGRYLLEDASVHQLWAERDLLTADAGASGGHVLVVGDPAFGDPAPKAGGPVPSRFRALAGAREEALWLARAFGIRSTARVELLLGDEASETRWRAGAPGAAVLHLATHGFYLPPGAIRPGGGPVDAASRGVGSLVAAGEVAEGLAGFALAGANRDAPEKVAEPGLEHGLDDGLVLADEIRVMDLRRTRLVVLSFCDGGLGRAQRGEGIFGLGRAFRTAGARSLVMALAPIGDAESLAFMQIFYQALFAGAPVDRALRRAALARLDARRRDGLDTHPRRWGALVSLGEPVPVPVLKDGPKDD